LTIYEDNQAYVILAITDSPRHMHQSCTKVVNYHWFCEQMKKGFVHVEKIDRKLECANILTKAQFVLAHALFIHGCFNV